MMQNNSVETLLQQGHNQLDRGQYQAALETFQHTNELEPQNPKVLYGLGLTCYRLERYQESVEYLNQALQINPGYILALARRGLAYHELNWTEQATEDFEQAVLIEPQDYEGWHGRGIALDELKRSEQAIASYDQAIEIKPDYLWAWSNRGIALDDLGRYEEALASFNQAIEIKPDYLWAWNKRGIILYNLGRFDEALASFNQALQIKPDHNAAWYNRGNALANLGRLEEAIASYDQAIEIKPGWYEAWINRGIALANLGRLEEAIASSDQAIEIKPGWHEAWINRGIALDNLGRLEEAIASFDQAIQIKPNDPNAWQNRGLALAILGKLEEAIASYDQAIEIKPDSHEAWINRGTALDNLGRYEEAIASYDQAIEIKPDSHEAWINRGTALDNLGRYEEAIASYDQAIEIKPDSHEAWINRGTALRNLGRYEEAIASYDRAIEIKPDSPEAWGNRGIALDNLGRYEEAIASYDRAIEIKPDSPEAWGNRGIALDNLGRYEEAIASYDRAIQIKPDFDGVWNNWDILVKKQQNPFPYWIKAKKTCNQALEQITFQQFPLRHLAVLQYLLKVCSYLGDTETTDQQLEKGRQQLDELLQQCELEGQKINLERKFAAFAQLRVDTLAQSPQKHKQIEALVTAEKRKNTCLGWLREGWEYKAPSPNYQQMQQLLNAKTAVIYWHVSPVSITTFILRHNQDPQVHQPPKASSTPRKKKLWDFFQKQPKEYPADTYQIREFEAWLNEWKSDYQAHRNTNQSTSAKAQSSWRTRLYSRLNKLGEILNIQQIVAQLPPDVNQLILIPHRDLHLLPLHYLFPRRFIITYLPSAQIGIHLPPSQPITSILNVENPRRDLPFATIEAIAISYLYPQCQQLEIPAITKEQMLRALAGNSDTFHFTGHGYHDIEQPQNSALLLAHLDKLTLEDIFNKTNNLDFSKYKLICLSACESGITSQQNLIDEYVGLVSGFLAQGATCVISTLWNVDEQSAALLMIEFYQLLSAGKTPAVALKEAQDWLRHLTYLKLAEWYLKLARILEENEPNCSAFLETLAAIIQKDSAKMVTFKLPFEDPYHWAGFILTGRPP